MEIKISKEIRNYTESVFFGLSARQSIFSIVALAVSVGLYFLLEPYLGLETTSWVCIVGAFPFAMCGFFKYNGMSAEQFVVAYVKSQVLCAKRFVCNPQNIYYNVTMKGKKNEKRK